MALILDTGVIYAYLDRRDSKHGACLRLIDHAMESLLVPGPVVVELEWLIDSRSLGRAAFSRFLLDVTNGAFEIVDLHHADYSRISELLSQYADANIGFVDASVFAIAERLNEPKVATVDKRHFSFVRLRHVDYLTLLP